MASYVTTYKFIPYGLARKTTPETYAACIRCNNQFLGNQKCVAIFGMTKTLLYKDVRCEDSDTTYMKEIMRCEAIRGLEKTFCSDDLGKWFLLTTKAQEKDVKKFANQVFPKIFKSFDKKI